MDPSALLRSAGFGGEGLDLRLSAAPRGSTVAGLSTDPELLAQVVDQYAEMHRDQFGPSARRDISALWLLQDVSWLHAALAVGLLPAHRLSITTPPTGLTMELPRDWAFAVQARPEDLTTAVATTTDEAAMLYAAARTYLAETLGGFVEAIRPHLRTGPHAAWACVTDMATGAICTGAGRLGDSPRVRQELGMFMRTGLPGPLLTGVRMTSSPTGPIRMRKGCCLLYAIDGMDLCFSCPRLPPA